MLMLTLKDGDPVAAGIVAGTIFCNNVKGRMPI